MKLFVIILPWLVFFYLAGIFSNILWNKFLKRKEEKIRIRIENQTMNKKLEQIPTQEIAEELFDRDEVWDVISEQARKKQ
jgi:hypothetical protein